MGKLNFVVKILDFRMTIPKIQNTIIFKLITKFPKIKLIGKKPKARFINEAELIEKFSFLRLVKLFNI